MTWRPASSLGADQASIYRPALTMIRPGFMQAGRAWALRNTVRHHSLMFSFVQGEG